MEEAYDTHPPTRRKEEHLLPHPLAVELRSVSKKYRLFDSHWDRLKEALHPFHHHYHREFWALKDINVSICKGECLGILGQNGSGKSTLLQIIAGILRPSKGEVGVNGRVSALLELGAGFNPDFTGRQNVVMNGAILGIPRDEILARMPQIEAFADIGEFFNQPVKTYSSGMYVRVAFAVAINVDPDILIIDEALAVGDARFQHKCFAKLDGFRAAKKTIILVTHDINQVTSHCDRAVLLEHGQVLMDGAPRDVADRYVDLLFGDLASPRQAAATVDRSGRLAVSAEIATTQSKGGIMLDAGEYLQSRKSYYKDETRYGNGNATILDCVLESGGVFDPDSVKTRASFELYLKVVFHRPFDPLIGFALKTVDGIQIYGTNTHMLRAEVPRCQAGEVRLFKFTFLPMLRPGEYFLDLGVASVDGTEGGEPADVRRSVILFMVMDDGPPRWGGLYDLNPRFEEVHLGKGLEVIA